MLLFIPMCSTSGRHQTDFKTSYVTVYHVASCSMTVQHNHFKTSYVTVYRHLQYPHICASKISKHRMLLFILNTDRYSEHRAKFQNIVCYCLSQSVVITSRKRTDFKTSYVTVYRGRLIGSLSSLKISKHRMLLFILESARVTASFDQFQNIVCYCLSYA